MGMRSIAIDRSGGRSKGHITLLDLTESDNLKLLLDYIRQEKDNIILIHLAPPCGTCSAARKILRKSLIALGFDMPMPLRDEQHPMGLPTLKGLDAHKVQQANKLYWATKIIATLAIQLGLRVSIENPTNSLFWLTDPIRQLLEEHPGRHNIFHNCMMGGNRDKKTTWWASDSFFDSFQLECSGDHEHKPWSPTIQTGSRLFFPTSEEAEYPPLLCERVAMLLRQDLIDKDICPTETFQTQLEQRRTTAINTVAMGMLPRGQQLKPLVSEFADYAALAIQIPTKAELYLGQFPKGARIVDRKLTTWGMVRVSDKITITQQLQDLTANNSIQDNTAVEVIKVGIPRSPQDFLQQAIKVGHPRFLPYTSSSEVDFLVEANLGLASNKLLAKRNAFLRHWVDRAKSLAPDEERLHASMPPHIQDVLKGKRLLVYKEMLHAVGFPDERLFHDIIRGFKLTGWMRDSGCFLKIPRPPTLTLEALWRLNRGLQESVLKRVRDQALDSTSQEAWAETEKELQKGWIWEDAAVDLCGKVIAHRFGLAQKTKVRVIDNFKQCGLNETCGLPERYVLHGVDYIAATLVRGLAMAGLDNGLKLEGKTFDLTSAYKQFPIHSDDRSFVRIALKDPATEQCRVFGVNALPFGATGSVAGFLRVSLSIFYILTKGMQVWASAFFDDFPTLSLKSHSNLTDSAVSALFDLLGISFAKEGKKKTDFGSCMKALGLIFDLAEFGNGKIFIRHTEERKTLLVARIDEILSADSLTPKEAESLRGRMHWYESYLFGRTANLAVHQLGKRISGPPWVKRLDKELSSALTLLRDRVLNGPPITLTAATETPLIIFTDGACEAEIGSVGGILYCGSCKPLRYFSSKVPDLLLREFSTEAQNPIFLVELLACYLAAFLWGPEAVGRYVVVYLDNEAAKGAVIKGYSSTLLGNVLVKLTISAEELN